MWTWVGLHVPGDEALDDDSLIRLTQLSEACNVSKGRKLGANIKLSLSWLALQKWSAIFLTDTRPPAKDAAPGTTRFLILLSWLRTETDTPWVDGQFCPVTKSQLFWNSFVDSVLLILWQWHWWRRKWPGVMIKGMMKGCGAEVQKKLTIWFLICPQLDNHRP